MQDLRDIGAVPVVMSLETTTAKDVAALLKPMEADAVLFAAGAGGKDGVERTRTVDYQGALNVYEGCRIAGVKRFVMISAVDVRDRSKPAPAHYTDESKSMSDRVWKAIGPCESPGQQGEAGGLQHATHDQD